MVDAFSQDWFGGFGARIALGTKLMKRDADRVAFAPELATRLVFGVRLSPTFALEVNARALWFGKWVRAEQTVQGLSSRRAFATKLLYLLLALRLDDLG